MVCYKLFRLRKNNTLGSLFINARDVIQENKWLEAKCYPTKGFKIRPGWHVTKKPVAPHQDLEKSGDKELRENCKT